MENPCLTFVTPTLLAGDRSLADVICHEIAHSWTGNLVTTRTWEHFWLNEGCTMWVQRKIMERLHGEHFFDFDARIGQKALADNVEVMGSDNPLTALVGALASTVLPSVLHFAAVHNALLLRPAQIPKLDGVDPDDAFSTVPYEKGFSLVYHLQDVAGGAKAFDPWFRSYIEKYAGKTVTSEEFKAHYLATFESKVDTSVIDWNKWFFSAGLVDWEHNWDDTLRNKCIALADKWVAGGEECTTSEEWDAMNTGQRITVLEYLQDVQAANKADDKLTHDIAAIARMDKLYVA